jgi:uncharacterized protein YjiS (DUF1127 family)
MAALVHPHLINSQAMARAPGRSAAPRSGLLANLAADGLATLKLWRRRAQERRELAGFTWRDLRDIGASSSEVWDELRQPFWRSALRRSRD